MPTRAMNKGGVEDGGYVHSMRGLDEIYSGDRRLLVGGVEKKKGFVTNYCIQSISCSDESSSIGKNSDLSENSSEKKTGDCEEVQSSYKGPLDAMEALEEVLPIRRGISRFYNSKSKSFASIADVSCSSSIKDLAKPKTAYVRRRIALDKTRSSPLKSNGGGISKRVPSTSPISLALAVAMNNSEGDSSTSLSGLSPRKDFSVWRSYSLVDLQRCVAVATSPSRNLNHVDTKPS